MKETDIKTISAEDIADLENRIDMLDIEMKALTDKQNQDVFDSVKRDMQINKFIDRILDHIIKLQGQLKKGGE